MPKLPQLSSIRKTKVTARRTPSCQNVEEDPSCALLKEERIDVSSIEEDVARPKPLVARVVPLVP